GAPTPRHRRGGSPLPSLRSRHRPRHGGCAHVRRRALRAGERSRPARERPDRAPAPPAARAAHGRGAGVAARDRGGAGAAAPAVAERSIPISTVLGEARPADLEGNTLTVEFPANASFHRQLAEEPKNATLLADALYEVTGRRLALAFAVGDEHEGEGGEELEG